MRAEAMTQPITGTSTVQPASRTNPRITTAVSPKLRWPPPMINPAEIASSRFLGFTADRRNPSRGFGGRHGVNRRHPLRHRCLFTLGRPSSPFLYSQEQQQRAQDDLDHPSDRGGAGGGFLWQYGRQQGAEHDRDDDASQPRRKPTLVAFALGDSNMKIAAMIGIG
jgi:hypothetical protein